MVFVEASRHWVMNYACLLDEVFRGYGADRDAGLGPVLALMGLPPSALPSLLPAPRSPCPALREAGRAKNSSRVLSALMRCQQDATRAF